MKQRYSSTHLIQLLYNELSASERLAVEEALQSDAALRKEYERLNSAYRQLPKAQFSASEKTLQRILGYSSRTTMEKQA